MTTIVINKVVAFINKTYRLLNNPQYKEVISWSYDGNNLIILDPVTFEKEVLPTFFRHKNIKSFVRQLNLYGFRKNKKLLGKDSFQHPNFHRDYPQLLKQISRRTSKREQEKENDLPISTFGTQIQKSTLKQLNSQDTIFNTQQSQKETVNKLPDQFEFDWYQSVAPSSQFDLDFLADRGINTCSFQIDN